VLDVGRQEVRDVLPDAVPAICWFSQKAGLQTTLAAQ